MDRLKRTFSFRKKKKKSSAKVPEANKPHQWQEDERKVREGTCSFQVKYLGTIEVFESRGMQVCEEAIKSLKSSKGKHQRAVLYVSGDALRVVDEISKGLIVDQTIEKVSFCAPDRHHDKGFAYICRDGATKRWMCHGFLAVKESGERLSHAVGCAFAICLEKKQKREKEAVEVQFSEDRTSFTRMGSFRQTTLTEKMQDPQSAIIAEPIPPASGSPAASGGGFDNSAVLTATAAPTSPASASRIGDLQGVQRPHASASLLDRQGSMRMFPRLTETAQSPFKRNLSLRLGELPSNQQRQQLQQNSFSFNGFGTAIPEASPTLEAGALDSTDHAMGDFTQKLNAMSFEAGGAAAAPALSQPPRWGLGPFPNQTPATNPFPPPAAAAAAPPPPQPVQSSPFGVAPFVPQPNNPWASESLAWNNSPQRNGMWGSPLQGAGAAGAGAGPVARRPPLNVAHMKSHSVTGAGAGAAAVGHNDPFDVAWAEKTASSNVHASTNPFAAAAAASGAAGTQKAFEVQM